MFDIQQTDVSEVIIISPKVFYDNRGYFYESFSERALKEVGIDFVCKQENHIYNIMKGVIRGLHFQNNPYAQAKIVRCTKGVVDDFAVDLRKGSPTYLKWVKVELSEENKKMLYIPKGFAHGVISRSESSEIQYFVDEVYHPEADRNIKYNDPMINVDWGIESPIISEKDMNAPILDKSDCNFKYQL